MDHFDPTSLVSRKRLGNPRSFRKLVLIELQQLRAITQVVRFGIRYICRVVSNAGDGIFRSQRLQRTRDMVCNLGAFHKPLEVDLRMGLGPFEAELGAKVERAR